MMSDTSLEAENTAVLYRQGNHILLLAGCTSIGQSGGDQQSIPEEKRAAPVRRVLWEIS